MFTVSVDDITTGYEGTVTETQIPWVQELIEEAELVLESRLGNLAAWAGTDLRSRSLALVVKRMVRRVLRNPAGERSDTESIGPYSQSSTLDPRVSAGSIWATDDDWALLGVSSRKVGTIKVGSAYRCTGPRYF